MASPDRPSSPWWGVTLVLSLAMLLPLTLYTMRFVSSERTLYRADQLAYWTYSTGLAAGLKSHPLAAMVNIADSVANSELNLLPAVPIAMSMTVLGPSRLAYLVSVVNIYGLAVMLALVMALVTIRQKSSRPPPAAVFVGAASAILLLPGLWQPVFLGYLGLGGVALCIVVFALYLRRDAADLSLLDMVLIGFLIAVVAIFRRWYAFWSVALCAVILLESAAAAWHGRAQGRRRVVEALRPAAIIGLSSVVTMAVLAAPVAMRRLSGGYSEEFVGFASGSGIIGTFRAVVSEYGLITMAVAAAALVGLARRQSTRRIAAVIGLHLILTFVMMASLQAHDPQHWYLYAAGLLVLVGSWIVRLLGGVPRARKRILAGASVVAIGLLTSAAVLLPIAAPVADALGPLLPGLRVRPAVRQDLDEVVRLMTRARRGHHPAAGLHLCPRMHIGPVGAVAGFCQPFSGHRVLVPSLDPPDRSRRSQGRLPRHAARVRLRGCARSPTDQPQAVRTAGGDRADGEFPRGKGHRQCLPTDAGRVCSRWWCPGRRL